MADLGTKIEIDRIRTRLNKLGMMGNQGIWDYNQYFSEFLKNGKLDYLYQCLDLHYDIQAQAFENFDLLKRETWTKVLTVAKHPIVEALSVNFKKAGVYQVGNEMRNTNSTNFGFELSPTLDEQLAIVATASKVGFSLSNGKVVIDVIDPKIYEINISSATWATYSSHPKDLLHIDSFEAGIYYETLSYTGSTSQISVTDYAIITNTASVAQTQLPGLNRIDLVVDIDHERVGDLQINLTAPNGRTLNAKRNGGVLDTGKNLRNIRFTTSDEHKRLIRTQKDNTTGTYLMDRFVGVGTSSFVSDATEAKQLAPDSTIAGEWTLAITDVGSGKTGTLNQWSLNLMASKQNVYLTQSQYSTEIQTETGGIYHIRVGTKEPFGRFLYRLRIAKNDILGTIKEIDATDTLDSKFYVRSRKVSQVSKAQKTYLEVTKSTTGETITFMGEIAGMSEEGNLIERYNQAIKFLLS